MRDLSLLVLGCGCALVFFVAAAPSGCSAGQQGSGGLGGAGTGGAAAGGMGGGISFGGGGAGPCYDSCSPDLHAIIDCHGNHLSECEGTDACNPDTLTCGDACTAAEGAKRSIGCDYYATFMDQVNTSSCFAAIVANTWNAPAHVEVSWQGIDLDVGSFTYVPLGMGTNLTYQPFNPFSGLLPGRVAILFLAGPDGVPAEGNPVCPYPSAVASGAALFDKTGKGHSFNIRTDVPVVAYQINPYGGGSAAITGSSLLLPTSAWGTNYIALNAYESGKPSMNIVAKEDDTHVTMMPVANIDGGGGLPPGSANGTFAFTLQAGEQAQLTQQVELSGSVLSSDKPVGFMAGSRCSFVPAGSYACDHLEQMIPPVPALGSEYVGVAHRPRSGEPAYWRLLGVVDGTTLSWSNDIGGPAAIDKGQVLEFSTHFPFVVHSQNADHPFLLMAHMTGGDTNNMGGVGDPDSVLSVPPSQYLREYVFFTDPSYPETNLVVVRAPTEGSLHKVYLDCAGELGGWEKVGGYEYTRIDLTKGDFESVGGCSNGAHRAWSDGLFGLWVWGWGSPQTTILTKYVSYGYPGGMNVAPINAVVVPPS